VFAVKSTVMLLVRPYFASKLNDRSTSFETGGEATRLVVTLAIAAGLNSRLRAAPGGSMPASVEANVRFWSAPWP
jgi:hypothetical protein